MYNIIYYKNTHACRILCGPKTPKLQYQMYNDTLTITVPILQAYNSSDAIGTTY